MDKQTASTQLDNSVVAQKLDEYIRPATFPVAVKFLPKEPRVILPCYGDRVFANAHDEETAFSVPWSKLGELLEGLQGTQMGGVRYPIPSFLTYEPGMPKKYEELLGMQRQQQAQLGSQNQT